jgi:hypothetical protein
MTYCFTRVQWNTCRSAVGVSQKVMTAVNSNDGKARFREGIDKSLSIQGGQFAHINIFRES